MRQFPHYEEANQKGKRLPLRASVQRRRCGPRMAGKEALAGRPGLPALWRGRRGMENHGQGKDTRTDCRARAAKEAHPQGAQRSVAMRGVPEAILSYG